MLTFEECKLYVNACIVIYIHNVLDFYFLGHRVVLLVVITVVEMLPISMVIIVSKEYEQSKVDHTKENFNAYMM